MATKTRTKPTTRRAKDMVLLRNAVINLRRDLRQELRKQVAINERMSTVKGDLSWGYDTIAKRIAAVENEMPRMREYLKTISERLIGIEQRLNEMPVLVDLTAATHQRLMRLQRALAQQRKKK